MTTGSNTSNLPAVYTIPDIDVMAKKVSASGMFGMTESQAFTLMLLAQAKGIHPIQAVERYHIIKGRPSMKADAMLGDFQDRGGKVEWHEYNEQKCSGTFSAPGMPKPITVTWTIADAKRAELLGNAMYQKYPRQMLKARVISEAIRMSMPSIITGIYTPEEMSDGADIEASYRIMDATPAESRSEGLARRLGATTAKEPEPTAPETPTEAPGPNGGGPADSWDEWIAKMIQKANAAWETEVRSVKGESVKVPPLANPWQMANYLAGEMITAGVLTAKEITNPKSQARDRAKTLAVVAAYFVEQSAWVKGVAKEHFQELHYRERTKLGITEPEEAEEVEAEAVAVDAEGGEVPNDDPKGGMPGGGWLTMPSIDALQADGTLCARCAVFIDDDEAKGFPRLCRGCEEAVREGKALPRRRLEGGRAKRK